MRVSDAELSALQSFVNRRAAEDSCTGCPPLLFRYEDKKPRQPEKSAADENLLLLALIMILAGDGGDMMLLLAVMYIMM